MHLASSNSFVCCAGHAPHLFVHWDSANWLLLSLSLLTHCQGDDLVRNVQVAGLQRSLHGSCTRLQVLDFACTEAVADALQLMLSLSSTLCAAVMMLVASAGRPSHLRYGKYGHAGQNLNLSNKRQRLQCLTTYTIGDFARICQMLSFPDQLRGKSKWTSSST